MGFLNSIISTGQMLTTLASASWSEETSATGAGDNIVQRDEYISPKTAPSCDSAPNPGACRVLKGGLYATGALTGAGLLASGALALLGAETAAASLFLLALSGGAIAVVGLAFVVAASI